MVTDAQTVNPVLNGGLEMPVEVTMDLTGVEDGREVSVSYGCCEEKGCRKGKAMLRACGKTFLFRALMTLVRELERKGTDDSFEKRKLCTWIKTVPCWTVPETVYSMWKR